MLKINKLCAPNSNQNKLFFVQRRWLQQLGIIMSDWSCRSEKTKPDTHNYLQRVGGIVGLNPEVEWMVAIVVSRASGTATIVWAVVWLRQESHNTSRREILSSNQHLDNALCSNVPIISDATSVWTHRVTAHYWESPNRLGLLSINHPRQQKGLGWGSMVTCCILTRLQNTSRLSHKPEHNKMHCQNLVTVHSLLCKTS